MIVRIGDGVDGVAIDTDSGGRLASLVLGGRERLLVEPCEAGVAPSLAWGCYLMAPFVGRLSRGEVRWNGRTARIPTNHGRHAIHGATFDVPWGITSVSANAAVITCELDPARWPFRGRLAQRIAITRGQLLLEAEIRADEPMPAALGWHPWFRRDGGLRVHVDSDRVLRLGSDSLPTGELERVAGDTDLRDAPSVDGRTLDHVFASAGSPAIVSWPDLELRIGFEPPVGSVVVYVHPQAVCVEPITAWPDAIRLAGADCPGTGLVILKAGERLAASTTWSWQAR
jgi:galactose mutarotase-like enzyme